MPGCWASVALAMWRMPGGASVLARMIGAGGAGAGAGAGSAVTTGAGVGCAGVSTIAGAGGGTPAPALHAIINAQETHAPRCTLLTIDRAS